MNIILDIPRDVPGAIAEFGCYKGLSSVALSIAAHHTGRKLLIFDSFEGLPESDETIGHIADEHTVTYKKGDYAGSLDEVRSVIEKIWGNQLCRIHQRLFLRYLDQAAQGGKICPDF
ncbi:MAG: TylF/MycF/NovP-related O-methyltransferase [Limisphaerales bacterium]